MVSSVLTERLSSGAHPNMHLECESDRVTLAKIEWREREADARTQSLEPFGRVCDPVPNRLWCKWMFTSLSTAAGITIRL